MWRRSHMRRTEGTFGLLGGVGLRFGHEVGEVGLHSAQALDIFFRGHGVWSAFASRLLDLLRADGAAFPLRLQLVDFLQELYVDLEQDVRALLFPTGRARRLWGGR